MQKNKPNNLQKIEDFINNQKLGNLPVCFLYLNSEVANKPIKMVYANSYRSNTFVMPFTKPISKCLLTPKPISNE